MKYAVITVAVVLGIIRPFLSPHSVSLPGSYEAVAHLFVGGIIGAWMVTRARWLMAIAVALSLVEVGSAIVGAMAR